MPGTAIPSPHSHLMFVTRHLYTALSPSSRSSDSCQGKHQCAWEEPIKVRHRANSSDQRAHSTSTNQGRTNVSGHISFIYLARACSAKYKNTTQEAIQPPGRREQPQARHITDPHPLEARVPLGTITSLPRMLAGPLKAHSPSLPSIHPCSIHPCLPLPPLPLHHHSTTQPYPQTLATSLLPSLPPPHHNRQQTKKKQGKKRTNKLNNTNQPPAPETADHRNKKTKAESGLSLTQNIPVQDKAEAPSFPESCASVQKGGCGRV